MLKILSSQLVQGGVTFTGIVGGTTPLISLLSAAGTTGTITLGGKCKYNGCPELCWAGLISDSDIALNVTGGTDSDDVSFGSTVTATSDSLDINVGRAGAM